LISDDYDHSSFLMFRLPMPQTSPKKPRQDTKSRILDKTEQLFQDIGYKKTNIADIAKALDMSPGNIYRFYESKQALQEAIAGRLLEGLEKTCAALIMARIPAQDRLRDLLLVSHNVHSERHKVAPKMHDLIEAAVSEKWAVARSHFKHLEHVLHRLVLEGVAAGEFKVTDIQAAAQCVQMAALGFLHPVIVVSHTPSPSIRLESMLDFILAGLGARRVP
jgi:AcrR family transcriptional regulator